MTREEEILNRFFNADEGFTGFETNCILSAMREYARERERIAAIWLLKRISLWEFENVEAEELYERHLEYLKQQK